MCEVLDVYIALYVHGIFLNPRISQRISKCPLNTLFPSFSFQDLWSVCCQSQLLPPPWAAVLLNSCHCLLWKKYPEDRAICSKEWALCHIKYRKVKRIKLFRELPERSNNDSSLAKSIGLFTPDTQICSVSPVSVRLLFWFNLVFLQLFLQLWGYWCSKLLWIRVTRRWD